MYSRWFSSRVISIVSVIVDVIGSVLGREGCIIVCKVGIVYSMIVYIVVLEIGIVGIVGDIEVIDVVNGLVVVGVVVSALVVVVSIVIGIVGGFVVGVYSVVDTAIRLLNVVCYEVSVVCVAGSF